LPNSSAAIRLCHQHLPHFSHKIMQRVEDGSVDVGIVTLPIKSPNLKMPPL